MGLSDGRVQHCCYPTLGCLLVHLISGVTRLWECPSCFVCHACSSPLEYDPHRSYLSSGSTLRVTPEHVIHSTRMDPRDLGFSLTDIWDPPLVAQLYCLSSRCPISPHCLVQVSTSWWLMSDHSWLFDARALWDTNSRRSWDPLMWHQHYQWSTTLKD